MKWFRDTFAAAEKKDGVDLYAKLNAELPAAPTDLLVLPHFDPPQWPQAIPDTAGIIMGLRTHTTRGDILKAIMEGTALYFVDGLAALHATGTRMTEFIAGGGGAKSDAWLQIKADIFGLPVVRPCTTEGGLAGCAMLAGMATGVFSSAAEAARVFVRRDRVFEPDAQRHAVYQQKHALYRQMFPANRDLLRGLRRAAKASCP